MSEQAKVKTLSVNVATNTEAYGAEESIRLEVTVTESEVPVEGASVDVVIWDSEKAVQASGSAVTDSHGKAFPVSKITHDDPVGTYTVEAVAKAENLEGRGYTNFKVGRPAADEIQPLREFQSSEAEEPPEEETMEDLVAQVKAINEGTAEPSEPEFEPIEKEHIPRVGRVRSVDAPIEEPEEKAEVEVEPEESEEEKLLGPMLYAPWRATWAAIGAAALALILLVVVIVFWPRGQDMSDVVKTAQATVSEISEDIAALKIRVAVIEKTALPSQPETPITVRQPTAPSAAEQPTKPANAQAEFDRLAKELGL